SRHSRSYGDWSSDVCSSELEPLDMSLQNTAAKADDDLDLARRIGARDPRAFETVMRAHNRMLYRLARSILKDDAEAENAVQEARSEERRVGKEGRWGGYGEH